MSLLDEDLSTLLRSERHQVPLAAATIPVTNHVAIWNPTDSDYEAGFGYTISTDTYKLGLSIYLPPMAIVNTQVPGLPQFFPLNEPAIGVRVDTNTQQDKDVAPKLFQPITLRNTVFKNRIFVVRRA